MGTSSSTAGPKSPEWTTAKTAATNLARGRAGATPRKVVRRTAQALGGGASAAGAAWSPGATRTAQRLGGLLGGAVGTGVIEAARRLGIGELEGRATGDAIMEILDWVAASVVDLDEQAARRAVEAVLSELVQDDIDLDNPLDLDTAIDLFHRFVVQYLTRTIITPLSARLTDNASASQSRQNEQEIARLVEALVKIDISPQRFSQIDWLGPEGAEVFEQLRNDALGVLAEDDL